ncbi:MAG TPA: hypothetical protein VFC18_17365 [Burkholderiales bacterium]|nr:hypothetical protein [Burkholderiales bacterium]
MKRTLLAAFVVIALPAHAQFAPPGAVPQRPAAAPAAPAIPAAPGATPFVQPGTSQTALQVQRIAPQLVAFAGSQTNFENLVNGLASGSQVTLTTVEPSGATMSATFTPAAGAIGSPVEIARALEATRQRFIASGIATPSAQQLGSTLAGTNVPVTLQTPVIMPGGFAASPPAVGTPPALPAATPATGLEPGAAASGGSLPSGAEQLQQQQQPQLPRVNRSDSARAGNLSDSPIPANPITPGPAITPPALEGAAPTTSPQPN